MHVVGTQEFTEECWVKVRVRLLWFSLRNCLRITSFRRHFWRKTACYVTTALSRSRGSLWMLTTLCYAERCLLDKCFLLTELVYQLLTHSCDLGSLFRLRWLRRGRKLEWFSKPCHINTAVAQNPDLSF